MLCYHGLSTEIRLACIRSIGFSPSSAFQPQFLKSCPVTLGSCISSFLSSSFPFRDFLASSQSYLIQRFHLVLPPRFFFLACFGEFHHHVHSSPLPFTPKNLL
jgi:hypothetical protein